MDFYKELLESFSRIKGRKLRLLEEEGLDPEAVALATQAKANAQGKTMGQVINTPVQTPSGKNLWVWQTGKGVITFNNKPESGWGSKPVDENWPAFVAAFTLEGSPEEPETPPKAEVIPKTPEETHVNRRIRDPELRESLLKVTEKAGSHRLELLQTLTGYGTNLTWNDDGGYTLRKNKKVNEDVTETLVGLIKEYQDADDGSLDPAKNSDFNCGQFKLYDGNVVMFPDSGPASDKGYVVSKSLETSNYLKKLYDDKTNCPPLEGVTAAKSTGAVIGTENNARGNLFEPIASLFCLQKYLANNPNLNSESALVVKEEAKNIYKKVVKELTQLTESAETWIGEGDAAMLPLEDMEEIDNMVKLVGGDKRYLKALFVATRASNVLRDPDMSIRVGDEVTDGKKQDQIDMWNTEKDANAARARTFPGRLTDAPKVVGKRAKDIFKDKRLLKSYIDSKQIENEDQVLWMAPVSLKSLMQSRPTGHTTGSTTINSMLGFLEGTGAQKELRRQFNGTGPKGRTPRDLLKVTDTKTEFDRITSEQKTINKAVDSLAFDNTVRTANGKEIAGVDSLKIQVDAVLKNMNSKLSWGELKNNKDRTAFNKLIQRHKATKNPKKQAALERELKTRLKTFMLRDHMHTSIQDTLNDQSKSDDTKKGALLFAAAHTYKAGASENDQTVVQKNYLESRQSYFSSHNAPFKSMLKSISNFKTNDKGEPEFDDWELSTRTGSKWTRKGPPLGRTLSTTTSPDGKITCNQSGALTIEESSIHDFVPKGSVPPKPEESDYLMDSLIVTSLGKIQEALGLLKEKMKLR